MSDQNAPLRYPLPGSDAERAARRIQAAEATEYPWWVILNPAALNLPHPDELARHRREAPNERTDYRDEVTASDLTATITGLFLSRESAEEHLRLAKHRFSDRAQVWCLSGYSSPDWRALCRESKIERRAFVCELPDGTLLDFDPWFVTQVHPVDRESRALDRPDLGAVLDCADGSHHLVVGTQASVAARWLTARAVL